MQPISLAEVVDQIHPSATTSPKGLIHIESTTTPDEVALTFQYTKPDGSHGEPFTWLLQVVG